MSLAQRKQRWLLPANREMAPVQMAGVRSVSAADSTRGTDVTQLDTGTEDLLADVSDGVAVLTMNRPDRRNAISEAMVAAMGRMLGELEIDDAVGCVVLVIVD